MGAAATYLVQPGDTLSKIATTTGVSQDQLVNLNAIKDPNVIIAGQSLSLTTAGGTSSGSTTPNQYTVKAGDTLWEIASSNGSSVADLVQLNGLGNADQLTVGQVLKLPTTAAAVQHAATVPAPTRPTAAPSASALQQKVAAAAVRVGGPNVHVGVAALNLTTGDKLTWHADDEFPSASVMKLPILVELERVFTDS